MVKAHFLEKIKDSGGRITGTRKLLAEVFTQSEGPLSLSAIVSSIKRRGSKIDRTTLYRELVFLVDNNIVQLVNLGDGKKYYEACFNHHHHLVCTSCRSITEIELGKCLGGYEKKFLKEFKFQTVSHSLEFYGLCKKCK